MDGDPRVPHARGDEPQPWIIGDRGGAGVPHARGDEPKEAGLAPLSVSVFPTHVGMNRTTS